MSTLSFVAPAFGAVTEVATLVAQLLAVAIGVRFVADVLDLVARLVAALRWVAGLVQLLFTLACALIADYAPVVGRTLGRWAGRAYVAGRLTRRWYERHVAPTAMTLVTGADRSARQFVIAQLGSEYPTLRSALSPRSVPAPVPVPVPAPTRRELLALAREVRLPRYSRLTTDQLRAALSV